jgi:hypothetical protein
MGIQPFPQKVAEGMGLGWPRGDGQISMRRAQALFVRLSGSSALAMPACRFYGSI